MITATQLIRTIILLALLPLLAACASPTPYKAYFGDPRPELQLATIRGGSFLRTELLNRYIDTIRFIEVDGVPVTNSDRHRAIQITPGFHDIRVYFHWDMGSVRGLAPAISDYSRTREDISRNLNFNARAGETYTVMAKPFFNSTVHNIVTMTHVDFWVEDEDGNEIVSKEAGRYKPE